MAKPFVHYILFLLLSLPNTISGHLIEETCKKLSSTSPNIKPDFCIASLQASPSSSTATNEVDLGLVLLELLLKSVTDAKARAGEVVGDPKLSPGEKSGVKDCLDSYSDAVTTTEEAIGEYKGRNYRGANVMISGVFECVSSCREGCGEAQGLVAPLEADNENVAQLSALVLSITNVVKV